jgi:glycosyltransferase involved in cell wall biosynthesis
MRTDRFDVVHVHAEHASFWTSLIALAAGRARVVRTVHSTFEFTGALRWRRAIQRRVLRRLGVTYVAVSESVASVERSRFGISPLVIRNWFDAERFDPTTRAKRQAARAALGISSDKKVVVSVGNCSEVKNHPLLIEAIAHMNASLSEAVLYLHVGAEDAQRTERQLATRLGIDEDVRFLGTRDDIDVVLAAADVFAMPSRGEGLGIAALEAAAAGLRLVLADAPGLRDVAAAFPLSATLAPHAAHAFAAALTSALAAGPLATREQLHHADRAAAWFGTRRGVDEYVAVYLHAAEAPRERVVEVSIQ